MGNPAPDISRQPPRWRALTALRRPWSRWDLVLALTLGPIAVLGASLVSERMRLVGHVMPGVWLNGVPIEGLSAEALTAQLRIRRWNIEQRDLMLQVGELRFPLAAAELGTTLDDRGLSERVLGAGRSGSPFEQVGWRLGRWLTPARFEARISLDRSSWAQHLTDWERSALVSPQEGSVLFEGRRAIAVEPKAGQAVDRVGAEALLLRALGGEVPPSFALPLRTATPRTRLDDVHDAVVRAEALLSSPLTLRVEHPPEVLHVPVPNSPNAAAPSAVHATPNETQAGVRTDDVEVLDPEAIAQLLESRAVEGPVPAIAISLSEAALSRWLEPIRERWERPATDAKFVIDRRGKISIEPSSVQVRIRTEDLASEVLRALHAEDRQGTLHLVLGDAPRITTELAQGLNITKLVGQFTTHHPCCRPRVKNIQRIADLIDGAVVLPGEAFSVNQHVGPRTPQNGFVSAPTIVLGEIKDTIGGGVSQFATTIFNAVFNAGYEIVERQPHSFYFTRYPPGHEATLSYPKPDFIFRNDTQSGVLLKTEYGPEFIRVKVYGDNEGRRVARHVSARFDFVEALVEYEPNDELEVGEEKVLERGEPGWSVLVSRVVTDSAGQAHKESRKVTYNPRTRRVAVHSCQIPKGEPGYTGRECPEPEETDESTDGNEDDRGDEHDNGRAADPQRPSAPPERGDSRERGDDPDLY